MSRSTGSVITGRIRHTSIGAVLRATSVINLGIEPGIFVLATKRSSQLSQQSIDLTTIGSAYLRLLPLSRFDLNAFLLVADNWLIRNGLCESQVNAHKYAIHESINVSKLRFVR